MASKKLSLCAAAVATVTAPILLAVLSTPVLRAQDKALSFDVASIKPNNTPPGGRLVPGGGRLRFLPGTVSGRNVTAKRIILDAYHTTEYQLSGGPGWIDSDRFDFEAKADKPATEDQLGRMLQTLLAERFHLTVRHETRDVQVYALTVGKKGPKLLEIKPGEPTPRPTPPPAGSKIGGVFMDKGTIQHFIESMLDRYPTVGRPVVDKTGLSGVYQFFVYWDEDENFMTAVQDELGLRFEARKAPLDTLVIEHIEKPDPN